MWNWSVAWHIVPQLLHGLKITVEATLLGSAFAMVGGAILLTARLALPRPLGLVVRFLSELIRRTPLLVQLYFYFYGLPSLGVTLPPFTCGVLGLGIHYSTYFAEVYRAGIESVPQGQWDATRALDLPGSTVWGSIVLPQAMKPVLPALGNQVIAMFKDSALLSVITVADLMATARSIGAYSYNYLEPIAVAASFYLIVSYVAGQLVRLYERRQYAWVL